MIPGPRDLCFPPLHASGHACSDELADLYRWRRPRLAVPTGRWTPGDDGTLQPVSP